MPFLGCKSKLAYSALQENLAAELAEPVDAPSAAIAWVQRRSGKFSAALTKTPPTARFYLR